MQSKAKTINEYLKELPADRRKSIETLREVIRKNLDPVIEEGMQYGMIGYYVPHSVYPDGYHCNPEQALPYIGLASQKNHLALYLMALYILPENEAWLRMEWSKTGKKLDMGKSCIRFKQADDLPLDVIAAAIRRTPVPEYISRYESLIKSAAKKKPAKKKVKTAKTAKSPKTATRAVRKKKSKKSKSAPR